MYLLEVLVNHFQLMRSKLLSKKSEFRGIELLYLLYLNSKAQGFIVFYFIFCYLRKRSIIGSSNKPFSVYEE